MKKLAILNDSSTFKVSDTDTLIPFGVYEGNNPVALQQGETAKFRIKNNIGFLMSVGVTNTNSGYTFNLNTKDLTTLTPGDYQIELTITDSDNNTAIYPDTGYVTITISDNALSITGQQLSYLSLDDFKKDINTYVNNQVSTAQTNIKNDFNNYVQSITDSTVNKANQALDKATHAQQFANTINLDMLFSGKAPGIDTPVDFNHIPQGIYSGNGWSDIVWQQSGFPDFAKNNFFLLEVFNVQDSYLLQVIYLPNGKVYEQVLTMSYSVVTTWSETSATASNPVISSISQKITNNTNSITTLNNTLNTLLNSNDLTAMAINKTVANFNQLLTTGVYTFNAWVDSVKDLGNVPFTNCWGSVVVFPFGIPSSGNVVQVAVNDKGSVLYRTGINSNFSNWQKLGGATGVTNLLLNSLAHNDSNWDTSNNGVNSNKYRGSNIDVINVAWNGVGPRLTNLFDRQVVNTDDFYTFSIYVKTDPGITITNDNMYFFNADNTVTPLIEPSLQFKNINSDTWYQLQVPFKFNKLQPPTSGKDYIRFELSQSIKGNVYFSCPKLERGLQASDYAPSPEDFTKLLTQSN